MNLWSGEGKRAEMGPRTWVLLGVLVLASFWALSQSKKPGHASQGTTSLSTPPAMAIILPADGTTKVTPEGWGKDPFDPNRAFNRSRNAGR